MIDPLQQAEYTRLHSERRLWLNARECLALRFPHTGCSACADECPTGALLRSSDTWTLTDDCVGCGRCAAQCPTRALLFTGIDGDATTPPPDKPLDIDCERVPTASTPEGPLRVPCLGALGVDELLRLVARSPDGVRLLDRDLCATCQAGGDAHPPVGDAIATTNALLDEMAVRAERRIAIESRALRDTPRPPAPAPAAHDRPVSRRHVWKALASEAVRARDAAQAPTPPARIGNAPPPDGRARVTPRKRLAVIARLRSLDETRVRPLPLRLRPGLAIAQSCRDHNLCVRLCPTGALELRESGAGKAIRFDADRCIECAACTRSCPEGAIGWQENTTDGSSGPRTLITHETRSCAECGADFVQRGNDDQDDALPTCPACRKSRHLMRSVFSDLFANRPG